MRNFSEWVTLYASERDRSLRCSMFFHNGNPRAGQTGAHIIVRPELDTIDVTNADPPQSASLPCVGNHSYIIRNRDVVGDFHELINLNSPPARRYRLVRQPHDGWYYWIFRP
jgi:esterase/lipase superfamily enzyme